VTNARCRKNTCGEIFLDEGLIHNRDVRGGAVIAVGKDATLQQFRSDLRVELDNRAVHRVEAEPRDCPWSPIRSISEILARYSAMTLRRSDMAALPPMLLQGQVSRRAADREHVLAGNELPGIGGLVVDGEPVAAD
jgi:hypothetical protein